MKRFPRVISLVPLLLAASAGAARFPKARGAVSDFAGVIDAGAREEMERSIAALEGRTGDELAVVTAASLDGDAIEDYAGALFKEWGIGKKGKDNGVLILLAVRDRKARIEVGYGLEGALPDGLCGEIIRNAMVPRFKEGDYARGLADGLTAVEGVLTGSPLAFKKAAPSTEKGVLQSAFLFGFLTGRVVPPVGVLMLLGFIGMAFFHVANFWFPVLGLLGFLGGLFIRFTQAPRRTFWSGGGNGFGGWSGGGGGGFGGFGGGSSGGGGASGGW